MPRYRVEIRARVIDAEVEALEAAVFSRPAGLVLDGELASLIDADTPPAALLAALTHAIELLET